MGTVPKTLLFSGFDVRAPEIPDEARILLPPVPLPALPDFEQAVTQALNEPVDGPPLSQRVSARSRVTVVVDDPSFPIPTTSKDCRRAAVEGVLNALAQAGVSARKVTVLVANGLSRQWKATELTDWFGVETTAAYAVRCHDAEDSAGLSAVGDTALGPAQLNRAMVDADALVYVNVVTRPVATGLWGAIEGTASYPTARALADPALLTSDPNPFSPGAAYHRAHEEIGAVLQKRVPVFQLAVVLNNEVWGPALAALLRGTHDVSRPIQMWNALPPVVRQRTARLLKAHYRPIAVFGGTPAGVAPRALEAFYRQHEVTTDGDAHILLFGLPDRGPSTVRSVSNPVLTAHLALGFIGQMSTGKPLLRPGGVIIFANPLAPVFDRRFHRPHEDFYERVLLAEREPGPLRSQFEAAFASRPEYVEGYRRKFAFHGAHPLHAWYACTPLRRRAGRIIVAYGDPRACARLGFSPAADVEDALRKASDFLGSARSDTLVMEVPPAFWVRAR